MVEDENQDEEKLKEREGLSDILNTINKMDIEYLEANVSKDILPLVELLKEGEILPEEMKKRILDSINKNGSPLLGK